MVVLQSMEVSGGKTGVFWDGKDTSVSSTGQYVMSNDEALMRTKFSLYADLP